MHHARFANDAVRARNVHDATRSSTSSKTTQRRSIPGCRRGVHGCKTASCMTSVRSAIAAGPTKSSSQVISRSTTQVRRANKQNKRISQRLTKASVPSKQQRGLFDRRTAQTSNVCSTRPVSGGTSSRSMRLASHSIAAVTRLSRAMICARLTIRVTRHNNDALARYASQRRCIDSR